MSEKEFPEGLSVKYPHEKAPDFVKMKISLKREALITWLQAKDDEWINLQVKESQKGNLYAEVDNWRPSHQAPVENAVPVAKDSFDTDDIPFANPYKSMWYLV